MPGHFGNAKTTVKGLRLVKVDSINNILLIKGCYPWIQWINRKGGSSIKVNILEINIKINQEIQQKI